MALPKETTTGEVICNKCGWLHLESEACKPECPSGVPGCKCGNTQTTYGTLLPNTPQFDLSALQQLRKDSKY